MLAHTWQWQPPAHLDQSETQTVLGYAGGRGVPIGKDRGEVYSAQKKDKGKK